MNLGAARLTSESMRTLLPIAALGLLSTQSVAAESYCNIWDNGAGIRVAFGTPFEDQATISSATGEVVCSLDTAEQGSEPWGYVEALDCAAGWEAARMLIPEGEAHASAMEFRGETYACAN